MKKNKKQRKLEVLKSLAANRERDQLLKQELLSQAVQSELLQKEFREMQNRLEILKSRRQSLVSEKENDPSAE